MDLVSIIGALAAIVSTVRFAPQAWKVIKSRRTEDISLRMYALSVVAGIFLPLGLLTGLLGINVGGMPGVDSPVAFTIVCVILVLIGLGQLWLFRRMRWL